LTKAKDLSISLNKNLADYQTQITGLQQRLTSLSAQKAEMIAKKLDKIQLPGHFELPCKRVLGKCIPLIPPPGIFIPGKLQPNPTFVALVNSITDLNNQVSGVQRKVDQTQRELQIAQASITSIESLEAELNTELDRLRNDLTKAKAALELAKGGVEFAQAIVQNLIPGLLLPTTA
jgi:predicted  nucleic acid-binding Zn-ribbon protein